VYVAIQGERVGDAYCAQRNHELSVAKDGEHRGGFDVWENGTNDMGDCVTFAIS